MGPVNVKLAKGLAWWLYYEVVRAEGEEGFNAFSPLSELKHEIELALHNSEQEVVKPEETK